MYLTNEEELVLKSWYKLSVLKKTYVKTSLKEFYEHYTKYCLYKKAPPVGKNKFSSFLFYLLSNDAVITRGSVEKKITRDGIFFYNLGINLGLNFSTEKK